ncbi:hypothetical protein OnM2_020090 [Erysiphe neolycopersici]|uniref:Uncharacterized protein n=1 Tax=Erysiphe neolycopersici TaxID=212602 RepID=A0A420I389_9PEZI|nr:hypothetical protein OnM2_020090 [Erysiphe neolycopersici]
MSWDSELSKYRQKNHDGDVIAVLSEAKSIATDEPWSLHVADPSLQSFLGPSFDPADYLNNNLPSIDRADISHSNKSDTFINELFPVAQNLVSQVSTNSARLTTILTQLTDEILRSGNRLAYEVEILRENTLNLSEALTGVLHDDLAKFVPTGINNDQKRENEVLETTNSTPKLESHALKNHEPSFLKELRTLTLVKSRLEEVIKTFGDAMLWSFPPSEVSTVSSFLSVSGPDIGSGSEGTSMEEKGQQVSKKIRCEISELLNSGDPISGIELAAKRVEELKELVIVWKGTSEERARLKFIESLARMVEDRHRDLLRDTENDSRSIRGSNIVQIDDKSEENKPLVGYGFINQLQKLRGS